jgi:wyosine [tRNA(Phe)-imidazoG37] synthetase (radical SAM superfamily)
MKAIIPKSRMALRSIISNKKCCMQRCILCETRKDVNIEQKQSQGIEKNGSVEKRIKKRSQRTFRYAVDNITSSIE